MTALVWTTDADGRDTTTVDGVTVCRWVGTDVWGIVLVAAPDNAAAVNVNYVGRGPGPKSQTGWDRLARWVARCVNDLHGGEM